MDIAFGDMDGDGLDGSVFGVEYPKESFESYKSNEIEVINVSINSSIGTKIAAITLLPFAGTVDFDINSGCFNDTMPKPLIPFYWNLTSFPATKIYLPENGTWLVYDKKDMGSPRSDLSSQLLTVVNGKMSWRPNFRFTAVSYTHLTLPTSDLV